MKILKLNIIFVISKSRTRKDGKAPLFCRLTLKEERKQFATGLFINPKHWYSKLQKAKPPNPDNQFINTQLSLIHNKLNQAFLFLQVKGDDFDVKDIYYQYKGEPTKKERSILEVFDLHNRRIEQLVGTEYSKFTFAKFAETRNHIYKFLQKQYGKKDMLLKDLTMKFVKDLDFYFKTERKQQQSTINKHIQRFRKTINLAIGEGFLEKDPFMLYKPAKEKKALVYLDSDELKELENYPFHQDRLSQVRDMFVFCCYTGLAYQEMANLRAAHIKEGFDGMKWIRMERQKTGSPIAIPLLPKALEILDKYQNEDEVLPVISNQKFNSYLKEITAVIGISKRVTHHIARKTFATTVLLYNDVPMEVVSELLGHSKLTITQEHYAKVVQKKVSEKMKDLGKKLKSK